MSLFGGLISGGLSLIGGERANSSNQKINNTNRDFNSAQAAISRTYNSAEAQKDRDFQESMSNTAVTRSMSDLKNAGINPMLAVGYNASTPGGATAHSNSASAPPPIQQQNAVGDAVNTGINAYNASANSELKQAQTALAQSQDALQSALIPGAEGIALVTEQLKNLASAVTDIVGSNKEEYKSLLGKISSQLSTWLSKAEQVGTTPGEIIVNIVNSTDIGSKAIEIIKDAAQSRESSKAETGHY